MIYIFKLPLYIPISNKIYQTVVSSKLWKNPLTYNFEKYSNLNIYNKTGLNKFSISARVSKKNLVNKQNFQ